MKRKSLAEIRSMIERVGGSAYLATLDETLRAHAIPAIRRKAFPDCFRSRGGLGSRDKSYQPI